MLHINATLVSQLFLLVRTSSEYDESGMGNYGSYEGGKYYIPDTPSVSYQSDSPPQGSKVSYGVESSEGYNPAREEHGWTNGELKLHGSQQQEQPVVFIPGGLDDSTGGRKHFMPVADVTDPTHSLGRELVKVISKVVTNIIPTLRENAAVSKGDHHNMLPSTQPMTATHVPHRQHTPIAAPTSVDSRPASWNAPVQQPAPTHSHGSQNYTTPQTRCANIPTKAAAPATNYYLPIAGQESDDGSKYAQQMNTASVSKEMYKETVDVQSPRVPNVAAVSTPQRAGTNTMADSNSETGSKGAVTRPAGERTPKGAAVVGTSTSGKKNQDKNGKQAGKQTDGTKSGDKKAKTNKAAATTSRTKKSSAATPWTAVTFTLTVAGLAFLLIN